MSSMVRLRSLFVHHEWKWNAYKGIITRGGKSKREFVHSDLISREPITLVDSLFTPLANLPNFCTSVPKDLDEDLGETVYYGMSSMFVPPREFNTTILIVQLIIPYNPIRQIVEKVGLLRSLFLSLCRKLQNIFLHFPRASVERIIVIVHLDAVKSWNDTLGGREKGRKFRENIRGK